MNGEDNSGRKIREKLENYEAPVPGNVWESIQQALPPQADTTGKAPINPLGSAPYLMLVYLITVLSIGISIGTIFLSDKSEKLTSRPETPSATEQLGQENVGMPDKQAIGSNQSAAPVKKQPEHSTQSTTAVDSALAQLSPKRTSIADSPKATTDQNRDSRHPAVTRDVMDSDIRTAGTSKKRQHTQSEAAVKQDTALPTPITKGNGQIHPTGDMYPATVSATRPPGVTDPTDMPFSRQSVSETTSDKTDHQTSLSPRAEPTSSPGLALPDRVATVAIRKDLTNRDKQSDWSANRQTESEQLRKDSAQRLPETKAKENQLVNKPTGGYDSTRVYSNTSADSAQVAKNTPIKDSTAAQPEKDVAIIIETPSRQSRLSMDVILHGGLASTLAATSDSTGQATSSRRKWGAAQLSGGIRLNYQLSHRYTASSGLLLERMQWPDRYTKSLFTYDSTYQYRQDSLGTIIDSVLQVQERRSSFSVRQQNMATYIGIPFALTYRQQKNRLSYYFTLGIQLNILVSRHSNAITADSLAVPPNLPDENRFRRVVPQLVGNIGVSYRLSKTVSFLVEPRFQYTVSSVYKKQYPVNPRMYTIGITSGIRISF